MSLTLERIEALAPDQASLAAARKLLKPSNWPLLAAAEGLVWGDCQGSGSTPYRVVISEADSGYKCSCPSRKFPCKHSLALMWMRTEGKTSFTSEPVPDWVKDWMSRRRGPAVAPTDSAPRASITLAATAEEEASSVDTPQRAAARERNRLDREAAILEGLDDLELWLNDQIQNGMANFLNHAQQSCRTIAQRLVDAKAPGLAARLDGIPTRLFTLANPLRPVAAIQELGQVHLIAKAYRRSAQLPPPLASDARQAIGLSITRDALLADASAPRVSGQWRVFAVQSHVQPDRLRRVESWLIRDNGPGYAVLIDYFPVSTGAAVGGYMVGDRIDAELVYYPSAVPLRAQIAQLHQSAVRSSDPLDLSLARGLAQYQSALAELPWLGSYPIAFQAATVRRSGEQLYLVDDAKQLALPLHSALATLALPLTPLPVFSGIGLWNGFEFSLVWAETSLGRWLWT